MADNGSTKVPVKLYFSASSDARVLKCRRPLPQTMLYQRPYRRRSLL